MPVDSVRRIRDNGTLELLPRRITSKFEFDEERSRTAQDLLTREGGEHPYEFEGQEITCTPFRFTTEPLFGSPKKIEGVIERRKSSQLVFLILDQDTPKPDTVFSELIDSVDQDLSIETDFSPTHQKICDFIRSAKEIIKVSSPVAYEGEEINRIHSGEDLPVEIARLKFEFQNDSGVVTYADGQLDIPLPDKEDNLIDSVCKGVSLREYIIQQFEAAVVSR